MRRSDDRRCAGIESKQQEEEEEVERSGKCGTTDSPVLTVPLSTTPTPFKAIEPELKEKQLLSVRC